MLKKYFILSIFLCACFACDENMSSTIPYAPVNLTLDLSGVDNVLNGSLSYKEYTVPQLATDRLGYGGILVINGLGENTINLYAYDLACPNEGQQSVKVKPNSNGLNATCPKCNAVYYIAKSGFPESGSKFWLRQYQVIPISDTKYRIGN